MTSLRQRSAGPVLDAVLLSLKTAVPILTAGLFGATRGNRKHLVGGWTQPDVTRRLARDGGFHQARTVPLSILGIRPTATMWNTTARQLLAEAPFSNRNDEERKGVGSQQESG